MAQKVSTPRWLDDTRGGQISGGTVVQRRLRCEDNGKGSWVRWRVEGSVGELG